MTYRVGIDIGGTFTDIIAVDDHGQQRTAKVPSTPPDYAVGVMEAIRALDVEPGEIGFFSHGTTVATNAVLQRKGAETGLITTRGFEDVLEIARADRGELFNYWWRAPDPLAHRLNRLGVTERINYAGAVVEPLVEADVVAAIERLKARGVESVAICCINSFVNPEHERRIREILEARWKGVFISVSSEVLPEIREFERCSTTVFNAYVGPVMDRYLSSLETRLSGAGYAGDILLMNSSGGVMTANLARRLPAASAVSGLAAGVTAGAAIAEQTGYGNLITLDVGGTSSDIALIYGGAPRQTQEWYLQFNIPVRLPTVDVHTIGAGGGSIGWIDKGGSLRVGPQSAGARPGPVCYGMGGTQPTLTDAWLVLGYIDADLWATQYRWRLDVDAAREAIRTQIAAPLGLGLEEAARAICEVTIHNLTQAIHLVSVQRGYDPRDFKLTAFGGAGSTIAVEVARELGIPEVVVPLVPGVTSALGLLQADVRLNYLQSVLMRQDAVDLGKLNATYAALAADAGERLTAEGIPPGKIRIVKQADLQYYGQSTGLTIPVPEGDLAESTLPLLFARFAEEHEREYGYTMPPEVAQVEIANVRLIGIGEMERTTMRPLASARAGESATRYVGQCYFSGAGYLPTPVLDRWGLRPDALVEGPAVITQADTTTIIPPVSSARLDEHFNLIIKA